MHIERIVTGQWHENCYILHNDAVQAIVIDPGDDSIVIIEYIRRAQLTPLAILNTHAHYDHVGAVENLKRTFSIPFGLHRGDFRLLKQANFYRGTFGAQGNIAVPSVDIDLADRSILDFGNISLRVIPCPGHTAGSVCFLVQEHLFTGDTLLPRQLGRTDMPGGNPEQLRESVRVLGMLSAETRIHPGHGDCATLNDILLNNVDLAGLMR